MNILKKIVAYALLSLSSLSACGIDFYSEFAKENYYNFLDASLVKVDENNPLYSLSGHISSYWVRVDYFRKIKQEANLQEWREYLDNSLTTKELQNLFYGEEGSLLMRYEEYKKRVDNSAFEYYLKFVAKQSKNVSEYEEEVTASNAQLSKEAIVSFQEESDPFLKLRYLFLGMRLAHYSGDYKRALMLYDKYYKEVANVKSIVVEWIDALRAGAWQHLGESTKANLLYAQIFKNNKTNAYLGYYDFKVESDEEWRELLSQAKDADQKALFYFLRALKWEGAPLLEHESMAKIAPKSIWFERLTYMIMQEFQEATFDYIIAEDKSASYVKQARRVYLLKEKRFLKTMASLKEPTFFDLYVELYLNLLNGKGLDAKKYAQLQKIATSKEQPLADLLSYLQEASEVTKISQNSLYAHLKRLYPKLSRVLQPSLFSYTALQSVPLYPKLSAKEIYSKIFADTSGYSAWKISPDSILADSFEAFVEEKNRNYYEQMLFRKSMKSLPKNGVAITLSLLFTKDGDYKKAQKYLNQVPKFNRTSDYNPFNVSLSGNNRKATKKGYTQRKFVKTMLKIEQSLKRNPQSAMDHFLYANGLYNVSWFGNSPMLASIWRTTNSIEKSRAEHIKHNISKIKKEYQLALKYATNKEFKAKVAYQLLKIAFNEEILLPNSDYIPQFKVSWDNSLHTLVRDSSRLKRLYSEYKKEYKDTKYGERMIWSCLTFDYFK